MVWLLPRKSIKLKTMEINIIRHSLAHILALAVQNLYPGAKFGIGPAIENGFYYDIEFPRKVTLEDLPKIEKEMKKIIKQNICFKKKVISKEKAKTFFKDQPYKKELIKEMPAKSVTIYESGDFTDLCKGPHVKSTREIKTDGFKLTKVAGAYWRGNENNPMLTRIYGVAFENKKELQKYLNLQEEAKKRDHRKLGKELDLFCFSDIVGAGLPLYTPKGTIVKEELQKEVETICYKYGFQKVITPHLAKIKLFEISGHAEKFNEELFRVSSKRGHRFVLKPVQCPHQTQIYEAKPRSYRDLPIRYMESEKQYRAEKPGEVGGLNRVYAITVEDGHSFCTIGQVKSEIKDMVKIIKKFYKSLGLWGNHWVSLSLRDYDHPEKYIGDKKDWDKCEKILEEICREMKLGAKKIEGEAALYGPKIDFMFKDALGKEIQIPTVQIDFATPKRFNLSYVDKKGRKRPPVMVHRAILGSYERIIALLIEHFAGAFPVWLSPVQVWVVPVGSDHRKYAEDIQKELSSNNIRSEAKTQAETVGKKIREGEKQKIPYILVVGDKEKKSNSVRVRKRKEGDTGMIKLKTFIRRVNKEIEQRK